MPSETDDVYYRENLHSIKLELMELNQKFDRHVIGDGNSGLMTRVARHEEQLENHDRTLRWLPVQWIITGFAVIVSCLGAMFGVLWKSGSGQ